jgi:hypothetical protein
MYYDIMMSQVRVVRTNITTVGPESRDSLSGPSSTVQFVRTLEVLISSVTVTRTLPTTHLERAMYEIANRERTVSYSLSLRERDSSSAIIIRKVIILSRERGWFRVSIIILLLRVRTTRE